jgi:hypothetical protein
VLPGCPGIPGYPTSPGSNSGSVREQWLPDLPEPPGRYHSIRFSQKFKKEERKGRKKEGGEEKGEIDMPVGGLDFAFL